MKDELRAFPRGYRDTVAEDNGGMTLRDYFAGQALSGYSANPDVDLYDHELARACYKKADAMLRERSIE